MTHMLLNVSLSFITIINCAVHYSIFSHQGVRLFLLKNPWSHLRWKGNYSENDVQHWTPEMKKTLNYDPKSAQNFDNGTLLYICDVMLFKLNQKRFSF